jgi:hypothetical protein
LLITVEVKMEGLDHSVRAFRVISAAQSLDNLEKGERPDSALPGAPLPGEDARSHPLRAVANAVTAAWVGGLSPRTIRLKLIELHRTIGTNLMSKFLEFRDDANTINAVLKWLRFGDGNDVEVVVIQRSGCSRSEVINI